MAGINQDLSLLKYGMSLDLVNCIASLRGTVARLL